MKKMIVKVRIIKMKLHANDYASDVKNWEIFQLKKFSDDSNHRN